MKMTIAIVALVGVLATPAMSQELQQSKLLVRPEQSRHQMVRPPHPRHSPNAANDVYASDGTYVGSDPDPIVRQSLYFDEAMRGND